MSKVKLTDYVVEFLQKKGIHDFFGYQGTMIAHLVDSIERNPETENHSGYNDSIGHRNRFTTGNSTTFRMQNCHFPSFRYSKTSHFK